MSKNPLFKVTIKDCVVETFRSGGAGGQHQNKRDSGVRIKHLPSGAVGESREQRQQLQNRRIAFRKMAESKTFQTWCKMQAAAIIEGHESLERKIDEQMREENIIVEYYDPEEKENA